MALIIPAVLRVHGAADRLACANNLKQIGMALHRFHDTAGRFPPLLERSVDSLTSWITMVMPFLGQPDDSPFASQIPTLQCPADPNVAGTGVWIDASMIANDMGLTSYLAILME